MYNSLELFDRIVKTLNKIAVFIAAFLTFAAVILIIADIVKRSVFGEAILWADEQIMYMLIWIVFLPAGHVTYHGKNVKLGILLNYLPKRIKMATVMYIKIVTLIFCTFVTIYGIKYFDVGLHRFSLSIAYSTKWIIISIPIGGALMVINLLYLLFLDISNFKKQNYCNMKE